MKLNLSCTDFSFPLLDHKSALTVIALLGLRGVDVGLFEGHGHLKPSLELVKPVRHGTALKRKLAAHGLKTADIFLQIHAGFIDFAINHPDAKRREFARDQFLRALDYAQATGSAHVTILPGVTFESETRGDSISRAADELLWRVERTKGTKLQLAVEPHVRSLINTPERSLDLISRVPGLGFTLDYAHFTRVGISDSRIEPLTPFTTHVHARAGRRGRLQSPLKENTIGFPGALASLRKNGFTGWIALEYVWSDWEHCNEVDILSESIQLKNLLETAAGKIK